MARTVGSIIRSSMRKVGILGAGEPLPPDEGEDVKEVFQDMIDAWSIEPLLIPVVNVVTHELQANESVYTIGIYPDPVPVPLPLNHIETARPEKILAAFIRDSSGTDYIQEQFDVQAFSRISRKTNGSRPSRFYVQKGWPLNTIKFESVPYANEFFHLTVVQPFSAVLPALSLTEVVNLPPGYAHGLIYNLALELAPEWGKNVPALVAIKAEMAKKKLKQSNGRQLTLVVDRALATQRKGIGTYIIEQGP